MFFFAWAVGEGFIIWRWIKAGAPPTPGALLLPSGVYLGLAVLAEYAPAATLATILAWGFDAAVALQVVGKTPKQVTGWPPAMINDPTVILPGGTTATTAELTAYQSGSQPSASVTNPSTGGGTGAGGTGGGQGLVLE